MKGERVVMIPFMIVVLIMLLMLSLYFASLAREGSLPVFDQIDKIIIQLLGL